MLRSHKLNITLDGKRLGFVEKLTITVKLNQLLPEATLVIKTENSLNEEHRYTKTALVKAWDDENIELITNT